MIEPKKTTVLQAAPRLLQILRVLARHKVLGAVLGRTHWPTPQEVRETIEELGLIFLKFGQVLAMRRDLLPQAYIDELALLHNRLPSMNFDVVRAKVESELGRPLRKCSHPSKKCRWVPPPSPKCTGQACTTGATWR